jgi:3-deoxy-D-manno-octulosonate 8-phosphate phosphatase (KDO 8-P phosphatase)
MNNHPEIQSRAKKIKLLILDVDGVLTDGTIWLSPDGTEYKSFHCQDGLGIKRLQTLTSIHIAVISGRYSETVNLRLTQLGVKHIYLGYPEKIPTYEKILSKLNLTDEDVCYVGDDLPDLGIMKRIILPVTVPNAIQTIKKNAKYITKKNGGSGAVREVCELLIQEHT